jgi:hypothetical protein
MSYVPRDPHEGKWAIGFVVLVAIFGAFMFVMQMVRGGGIQ